MRKVDLVARMVAATDLPKHTAEKAIEAVLAAISASLPQGEAVTLRGLGTFAVRTKRARQAATPRPERPRPFCPGGSSCLRPARSSSRPWRAPRRAAQQRRRRSRRARQPRRSGSSRARCRPSHRPRRPGLRPRAGLGGPLSAAAGGSPLCALPRRRPRPCPRGGCPARKRRLAHAMLAGQPHRRGKSVFALHA